MTAPARFRQADLRRAITATAAAGLGIARIEIAPDGKIVIIPGESSLPPPEPHEWADLEP